MKLPRYSLRTMLIAVAIIAAGVGWLRYEARRGWTVSKLEWLIKNEFKREWDKEQLMLWAQKYGFHGGEGFGYHLQYYNGPQGRKIDKILAVSVYAEDDSNRGLLAGIGPVSAYFYYDQDGNYLSHSVVKD
jgi:hypothetical protein